MTAWRPRRPGWYRDPGDPTSLRHWSGERWDGRRRTLPSWWIAAPELTGVDGLPETGPDGAVYEGPARPATLPAAAGSLGAGSPAGLPAIRPSRSHRGPGPAMPPRRGPSVRRSAVSTGWGRSTGRLVVAVALLAAVTLTITGSIVSPSHPTSRVPVLATDVAFLSAANRSCRSAMTGIRMATGPTIAAEGQSNLPNVADVDVANGRLVQLASRLRSLGRRSHLANALAGWLAQLAAYATARRTSATFAARYPHATGPTAQDLAALERSQRADAVHADRFAEANNLVACTLLPSAGSAEQIP
ncbi:MAG TPA: DUF2510 domain-containing protein [Acidimicrobiales bacterium]|nr:DUF2510 domain-containing protein [Acidimicrobiales bacterium]